MPRFEARTRAEAGRLVVTPVGEMDIAAVDAVRAAISRREQDLTLDLSELTFMDTSGVQVLVDAHRASREQGFTLSLVPAPPHVQRVLELAGLDGVLPFEAGDG